LSLVGKGSQSAFSAADDLKRLNASWGLFIKKIKLLLDVCFTNGLNG